MKNIKISLLVLTLFSLLLTNCTSSDDEDIVEIIEEIDKVRGTPGSITAEVNDDDFFASGSFVNGDVDEGQNEGYIISIVGARLKDGFGFGLVVSIFGTNFSSLNAGDVFVGSDTERLAIGGYTVNNVEDDNDEGEVDAIAELTSATTVTITEINRVDNLISGTFSFNAIDEDTGLVYEVRNGVFTDIEYD